MPYRAFYLRFFRGSPLKEKVERADIGLEFIDYVDLYCLDKFVGI